MTKLIMISAAAAALGIGLAPTAQAVNWDSVAQCESGNNWQINTGNNFHGGLQFSLPTWYANGGTGMPENASRSEQIRVAENTLRTQGIGAWPVCGARGGSSSPVPDRVDYERPRPVVAPVEAPAPPPPPVEEQAPDAPPLPAPFDIPGIAHVTFTSVPLGDGMITLPMFGPYVAPEETG